LKTDPANSSGSASKRTVLRRIATIGSGIALFAAASVGDTSSAGHLNGKIVVLP
jgi:hypothetical protein